MRRRRCAKKRYPRLVDARNAIDEMTRRYGVAVYKKPYRCARCDAWHVTGTPPRRGRRIKR